MQGGPGSSAGRMGHARPCGVGLRAATGRTCWSRASAVFAACAWGLALGLCAEPSAGQLAAAGGSSGVSDHYHHRPHSGHRERGRSSPPPPTPPPPVRPRKVPLLLIASVDGTVTAVKATTGSKIWSLELGAPLLTSWENTTIFKKQMIVPNTDGSLKLKAAVTYTRAYTNACTRACMHTCIIRACARALSLSLSLTHTHTHTHRISRRQLSRSRDASFTPAVSFPALVCARV